MNKPYRTPPRFLIFLLKRLISIEIRTGALGDFSEHYDWISRFRGRFVADIWYMAQILQLLPGYLFNHFYWEVGMFFNNMKLIFRNIKKQKIFSFINLFGLSVGLACSILLSLWVHDELSFDTFHEHSGSIYRIIEKNEYDSGISYSTSTPDPVAPLLMSHSPEIMDFARYWPETLTLKHGEQSYSLRGGIIDPSFLEMFSFPIIMGDSKNPLANPESVLLSEETALKIFGEKDPLGETLQIFDNIDIKVTGILADIPHNSHLQFSFLTPLSLPKKLGVLMDNWASSRYFSFVRLHPSASLEEVNEKIKDLEKKHAPGGSNSELQLQPLTKIYLYGLNKTGPIAYVYIFGLVAIFSLVLASINFINLTTARSAQRAKEIGIRKAVGANRRQIIRQLMSETICFTFAALLIAIFVVLLVLPAFNRFSGKHIDLNVLRYPGEGLALLGLTLLTGLLAGGYPAVFISSFKPVKTLKGISHFGIPGGAPGLRKVLVIFQFALSIALITCTTVIYSQLNYMRHKDLGIDVSNMVCIPVEGLADDYEMLKSELLQNTNILDITATSFPLASFAVGTSAAEWEGKKQGQRISMGLAMVDFDTFDTYRMEMAEGRPFQKEFATDSTEAYIVNQTAVSAMGLLNPVGKKFSWNQRDGNIVGVVKDFHNVSLREQIRPFVFMISPSWFRYLSVKINPAAGAISFLKEKWKQLRPEEELSYFFLDSYIEGFYRSEQRMEKVLQYFTLIAILISSLGLFGLTTYSTTQRTKEIGIRKVLGASVSRVAVLLSTEFINWLLIANVVAWPAAYFFMNMWLRNFANRINMGIWMFLFSTVLAVVIGLLTVSSQTIRTALADPVDSLRYE